MKTPPGIAPDIFYDLEFCPIRSVFNGLNGKWGGLVISHLSFGTHRFSELLAAVPDISQRMLTQTLRGLERDGMISRSVQATIPPRVDYRLTALGQSYLDGFEKMLKWCLENRGEIENQRAAYDREKMKPTAKTARA